MMPKLSKEQRDALNQQPGKPLQVEDEETHKKYVLIDQQALPTLWEDYIRREVQQGLDAIDRGEVEPWDIEATVAEAKRRHGAADQ